MNDDEQGRFVKDITYMFSLYPNASVHEGTADAYWAHLRRFSLASVRIGVSRALKASPTFPPTAPAIAEIAEVEHRAEAARALDRPTTQKLLPRASWEGIPREPEQQRAYVQAATTGFERLARIAECEAVRRNLHPSAPPPAEVGARLQNEISGLWAKSGAKAKLPDAICGATEAPRRDATDLDDAK